MKTELEKLRIKHTELDDAIAEIKGRQVSETGLMPKVISLIEMRSDCLKAIGTLTLGKLKSL